MTTLYALKPGFRRLLHLPARLLVDAGITANQVTTFTCLLSILLGITLTQETLLLLPPFLLLRMALNAIDGVMATEFHQQSAVGAYLNELSDVFSDAFLYLPFALLGILDPLWMGAVILLSAISEMAGVLGPTRRYDGPLGKSDRAFVFGSLALWIGLGNSLPAWIEYWLPPFLAVLLAVTIVNRVMKGLSTNAHPAK